MGLRGAGIVAGGGGKRVSDDDGRVFADHAGDSGGLFEGGAIGIRGNTEGEM